MSSPTVIMNRLNHDCNWVMVLAGISYGQGTHMHFIDGNFSAQRYSITRSWGPLLYQSSAEYTCSADISPTEHIWDSQDRHTWQYFLLPANPDFTQRGWTNIPQTTINNLINSSPWHVKSTFQFLTNYFTQDKTAHFGPLLWPD